MPRPIQNPVRNARIIALYRDGRTTGEISALLSVTKGTVSGVLLRELPSEERTAIQKRAGRKSAKPSRPNRVRYAKRRRPQTGEWLEDTSEAIADQVILLGLNLANRPLPAWVNVL